MEELGYDLPKQPIAWIGTERVTISNLTRNLIIPLKS